MSELAVAAYGIFSTSETPGTLEWLKGGANTMAPKIFMFFFFKVFLGLWGFLKASQIEVQGILPIPVNCMWSVKARSKYDTPHVNVG